MFFIIVKDKVVCEIRHEKTAKRVRSLVAKVLTEERVRLASDKRSHIK